MGIRNAKLGGSDYTDNEVPAADDYNDTNNAIINGGMLGEVKMFALSMTGSITKATLQAAGWAIQDGTTPVAQGISSPTITTTLDMQDKFIRMSNDETSGNTGGSDEHNHQWLISDTDTQAFIQTSGSGTTDSPDTYQSNGSSTMDLYDQGSSGTRINGNAYTKNESTLPSYVEMAFFMKVKVV